MLGSQALSDRALPAREALRDLLVGEERHDRDVGGSGLGRPDSAELHSLLPLVSARTPNDLIELRMAGRGIVDEDAIVAHASREAVIVEEL